MFIPAMKVLLLLCILSASALAERRRYDGYQLWTFTPTTKLQLKMLDSLKEQVMTWSDEFLLGYGAEMLVSPEMLNSTTRYFHQVSLKHEVDSVNFQQNMDELWQRLDKKQYATHYDYNDWNNLEKMEAEMNRLVKNCPAELKCEIVSIGKTWENRKIWRITVAKAGDPGRRGIYLDSLIHAREWLAGTTNMNILRHMIEEYKSDADVRELLEDFTFYFTPVSNPDGYSYTHIGERFWRKNMRPANMGTGCLGVDLNRNYDYKWGQHSSSICHYENFQGPSPASEPETRALMEQAKELNADGSLMMWIQIHTAVPIYLMPYAHRNNGRCVVPETYYNELMPVAAAAVSAISQVNGERRWGYGSVCLVLATASGDSLGFNYGEAGVRFAYAPELRGPGFDPPKSAISLSYKENWAGLVAMLRKAKQIVEA